MKLPANCPHRRSAKNWSSTLSCGGDLDQPACCRTTDGDILRPFLPKRGPLCESRDRTPEEYRFTWHSSFHGAAVVQIGNGKNIILDWARSGWGTNGRYWCCIAKAQWKRLEAAVLAAKFWGLDADIDRLGCDGAQWLIEGHRGDMYRAVRRWSPDGAIHDLGRAFFDIAGPPIADIRLY